MFTPNRISTADRAPSRRQLSFEESERIMAEARRMQTRMFAEMIRRLARAVAAAVRGIAAALSRWEMRRALGAELRALDDHILADIGINRYEIPEIVDRAVRQAHAPKTTAKATVTIRRLEESRPKPKGDEATRSKAA